ncbi:MAG: molybdopterin molybdotransferase MoeA [Dorea sp.]|uniref:molybdopterin molybdotransferase MoeA n=1 Tax=Dorea sp. YH-dor226 TaxID=3151119 RepID=UPI003044149D|nr:molybdopterin molybdotransferase MoeA [Dorea sp.]
MDALMLEEALELILSRGKKIDECEEIALWDVVGRVLAEDVVAQRNQPPFPRSPLDGYAVRSSDIKGASREYPVTLTVIAEVDAGHVVQEMVGEGEAIRIMTGAPIPDGADCIIGQEDTDYGESRVNVYEEVEAWQNYCFEGEDYRAGTILLKKGTVLGSAEAGILASLGLTRVCVYRRPRIAVITTGDEILLPGEELLPGKIYDSNLYALVTRLRSWGVEISAKMRVEDDAKKVAELVKKVMTDADLVVTTGGVSVGKKDIMHEVLKILNCEKLFWRIAVKPGMPTLCASCQGKLLVCLSGNPYGAVANLELLIRPLLAEMTGREDLKIQRRRAVCENTFPKKSMVTRYVRAHYSDGKVRIASGSNASGILSSMCGCNCLIVIPAGTERIEKDDEVEVILL